MVEPVVGGLAGDDGFDEVVSGGIQQRGDVADGVPAARPGQRGRQQRPQPGVIEREAVAAGVGQRAEQIFDAVLLGLVADTGEVLVHDLGDCLRELRPAGVVRANRLVAPQQRAADQLADQEHRIGGLRDSGGDLPGEGLPAPVRGGREIGEQQPPADILGEIISR